ncbi:DUF3885 domain-containing protein [Metabacillus malikii]|uniref:DUF3885 domain-containing protein n=1 Tax=Metabacillus malikii TaxID=1504265 RepID=A0ABT9ZNF5_9BACI|nr:DUF3885 domain-containing protein [Metabacillus malikii]MDQ0233347.1 hypothetical protein [Metabacillus malikii]
MDIENYLKLKFPRLELVPSIYYQWEIGIHFSLGGDIYQLTETGELNLERFKLVYKQITTLFDELFQNDDELLLVTNLYKDKTVAARKLKVYQSFLKCKKDLYRIKVKTYPYPFESDDAEQLEMQQFSVPCKREDLIISGLLKAASHEDFPLTPKFGKTLNSYPDVFIVNMTKDIIFFIYDDRGCEIIANQRDLLSPLYEKYYDWVEEVDRKRIEKGLGVKG